MIKGIIFDLDNTLMDFMTMKMRSCEAAISAMIDAGLPMSKDDSLQELYELYDEHGIEDKEIFQKFLKKTIGDIDWKILSAGIVAYRRIKAGFISPYPHVNSTLLKLKEWSPEKKLIVLNLTLSIKMGVYCLQSFLDK